MSFINEIDSLIYEIVVAATCKKYLLVSFIYGGCSSNTELNNGRTSGAAVCFGLGSYLVYKLCLRYLNTDIVNLLIHACSDQQACELQHFVVDKCLHETGCVYCYNADDENETCSADDVISVNTESTRLFSPVDPASPAKLCRHRRSTNLSPAHLKVLKNARIDEQSLQEFSPVKLYSPRRSRSRLKDQQRGGPDQMRRLSSTPKPATNDPLGHRTTRTNALDDLNRLGEDFVPSSDADSPPPIRRHLLGIMTTTARDIENNNSIISISDISSQRSSMSKQFQWDNDSDFSAAGAPPLLADSELEALLAQCDGNNDISLIDLLNARILGAAVAAGEASHCRRQCGSNSICGSESHSVVSEFSDYSVGVDRKIGEMTESNFSCLQSEISALKSDVRILDSAFGELKQSGCLSQDPRRLYTSCIIMDTESVCSRSDAISNNSTPVNRLLSRSQPPASTDWLRDDASPGGTSPTGSGSPAFARLMMPPCSLDLNNVAHFLSDVIPAVPTNFQSQPHDSKHTPHNSSAPVTSSSGSTLSPRFVRRLAQTAASCPTRSNSQQGFDAIMCIASELEDPMQLSASSSTGSSLLHGGNRQRGVIPRISLETENVGERKLRASNSVTDSCYSTDHWNSPYGSDQSYAETPASSEPVVRIGDIMARPGTAPESSRICSPQFLSPDDMLSHSTRKQRSKNIHDVSPLSKRVVGTAICGESGFGSSPLFEWDDPMFIGAMSHPTMDDYLIDDESSCWNYPSQDKTITSNCNQTRQIGAKLISVSDFALVYKSIEFKKVLNYLENKHGASSLAIFEQSSNLNCDWLLRIPLLGALLKGLPIFKCHRFDVVKEAIDASIHRYPCLRDWQFPHETTDTLAASKLSHSDRFVTCLERLWNLTQFVLQIRTHMRGESDLFSLLISLDMFLDSSVVNALKILMFLKALEVLDQIRFTRQPPMKFYNVLLKTSNVRELMQRLNSGQDFGDFELALLADALMVRLDVFVVGEESLNLTGQVAVYPDKLVDYPSISLVQPDSSRLESLCLALT